MNRSEGQTAVQRLNVRGGEIQVTGECGSAELIAWERSRRGAPLGSAVNFMEQQELAPSSSIIFSIQTSLLMSPDAGKSHQNNPVEFIAWGEMKIIYLRLNHPFNPHFLFSSSLAKVALTDPRRHDRKLWWSLFSEAEGDKTQAKSRLVIRLEVKKRYLVVCMLAIMNVKVGCFCQKSVLWLIYLHCFLMNGWCTF